MRRPRKHPDLLSEIRTRIELGSFLDTAHAAKRQSEREIARQEMLFVLKHGFHERRKDRFDERHRAWNYAVRGKTVDGRLLRVIVSFEGSELLLVTAFELAKAPVRP